MSHRGQKSAKKCHVLFECPLKVGLTISRRAYQMPAKSLLNCMKESESQKEGIKVLWRQTIEQYSASRRGDQKMQKKKYGWLILLTTPKCL